MPNPFLTMGKELSQNKSLQHLELNSCDISDKGVAALATDYFAFKGLKSIKLIKCKIGKSGFVSIFRSFENNQRMLETLEELNISQNKLEGCSFMEMRIASDKSLTNLTPSSRFLKNQR